MTDHVVAMETVSDERLAEILAGLEGVTPGPWERNEPGDGETLIATGDEHGEIIAVVPWGREITKAHEMGNAHRDASHIARLDPDTVRSIVSELLASRLAKQAPAPRTLDEWGEEDGDVVWWCWRNGQWLGETPYIGSPLDLGHAVEIELRSHQGEFIHRHDVGGWPGYHTHWTPCPTSPASPVLGEPKYDRISAALEVVASKGVTAACHLAKQAPAEWVLVPKVPTDEMLRAVQKTNTSTVVLEEWIYTTMLAAAPSPVGGSVS